MEMGTQWPDCLLGIRPLVEIRPLELEFFYPTNHSSKTLGATVTEMKW